MISTALETFTPDRLVYLDQLAETDEVRSLKERMLGELEIRPGHTVLDLGCGPGADLGSLAEAVTDTGRVIGVDHDQAAVDAARERVAARRNIEVRLGDAHDVPLADHTVDRARTDRVLQHVADPLRALQEVRRVLNPGGRIVMGEPDWDSLAIDHPDGDLSRAYSRYVSDKIIRNPRIGRQLPRLAEAAGFKVPLVAALTTVGRDFPETDRNFGVRRTTEHAVAAGYFTEESAQRWLDHLANAPFLGAVTFYVVVAEA